MSTDTLAQVKTIEAACTALTGEGSPAVRVSCDVILEQCHLLRWYYGEEQDILPQGHRQ